MHCIHLCAPACACVNSLTGQYSKRIHPYALGSTNLISAMLWWVSHACNVLITHFSLRLCCLISLVYYHCSKLRSAHESLMVHLCVQDENGRRPYPYNRDDAAALVQQAHKINEQATNKVDVDEVCALRQLHSHQPVPLTCFTLHHVMILCDSSTAEPA